MRCKVCNSFFCEHREVHNLKVVCSLECGKIHFGTPCGKGLWAHNNKECSCNPNWKKEGYCQHCYAKLRAFTVTTDWDNRKYHKVCWKEMNDYGM